MINTEEQIKQEIQKYIAESGYPYKDWYVGITDDHKERVLNEHNVKEQYIYGECSTSEIARKIEIYFIEILGTDGGSGGGDESSIFIYAYHKTENTVE